MKKILVLMIIFTAVTLSAQIYDDSVYKPNLLMSSFLDMNKVDMSHSVSFSSGISSNHQSYYQSAYTNHFSYRFNSKLRFDLDLNFVNFGTATYKQGIEFEGNNDNMSRVLPNFSLQYQPTENTSITLEFKQYHSPFDYNRYK